MKVEQDGNTKKWGISLIVASILLIVSIILSIVTISISEWLPLYFCWGDLLLLSAIIVIIFAFVTSAPFPVTDQKRLVEQLFGGVALAIAAFSLFALRPSCCGSYADQMRTLACFGTMIALFAFAIGTMFGRYSLLALAASSFYLWAYLIPVELVVISMTVICLGLAGLFLIWLHEAYPSPKKEPMEHPDPGDLFKDPGFIKAVRETMGNKSRAELSDDPDVAMAQLERMAQEQANASIDDDLPEWLTDLNEPQKDPLPVELFQESKVSNESSSALFAIFVVLLLGVLFFLTFVAVFIR